MSLRHALFAVLFLLTNLRPRFVSAQSPSFNCAQASSLRERTVCANAKLSARDAEVAAAYRLQLERLSAPAAALIRSDQREWLTWLDQVCSFKGAYGGTTEACLEDDYSSRLSQLSRSSPGPAHPVFYTRASFVLVPAKETRAGGRVANDPGFGTGEFTWLQIDQPTPAQAVWNKAILTAAIKTTEDTQTNQSPTSFTSSVDPTGTISVIVKLIAANHRSIVTSIQLSTYGYGAAHPLTERTYFSWWLDRGRALTIDDVFHRSADGGKDWQTALVPLIYAKLKPSLAENDQLWSATNVKGSIATELGKPAAWSIDREGFTLHFGQYEVGPYAIGTPQSTLPWHELESYLAPNLDPGTLPPPSEAAR